jgi:hypothetical protein
MKKIDTKHLLTRSIIVLTIIILWSLFWNNQGHQENKYSFFFWLMSIFATLFIGELLLIIEISKLPQRNKKNANYILLFMLVVLTIVLFIWISL